MITFTKNTEPKPGPNQSEENRFEQIRRVAKETHQKSDTDGTGRRQKQKAEDSTLI